MTNKVQTGGAAHGHGPNLSLRPGDTELGSSSRNDARADADAAARYRLYPGRNVSLARLRVRQYAQPLGELGGETRQMIGLF